MKKILSLSLLTVTSLFLVSCGQKNLDNIIITKETKIETKDQATKVCEPFEKYLICSIEKAEESKKGDLQNALKEIQRKIQNDEPGKVAAECDIYIKRLNDNPGLAFKNGCSAQSVYTDTSADKPTEVPVAPAAPEITAAKV